MNRRDVSLPERKREPKAEASERRRTAVDRSPRLSAAAFDNLIKALDVKVIALTEILVPRGYRAEMGRVDAPGIHYSLAGAGRFSIDGGPFQPLQPGVLIIVPPSTPFTIEVDGDAPRLKRMDQSCWKRDPEMGLLRGSVSGQLPEVVQICGFFKASFGTTVDLFGDLAVPVIEHFDATDRIDEKLREAMQELLHEEIGAGAMTAALLKQVIISLVRRSLKSSQSWAERFSVLSDPQITRAFSEMAARPGAAHTVHSLALTAGMSRSAFMARFAEIVGRSPMTLLREMRMRQAALDLSTTSAPIESVASDAGYESRSSFVRAFKAAYGQDPTEYRARSKP